MNETLARTIKLIGDDLGSVRLFGTAAEIGAETRFFADLNFSPLDMVCLICAVEEEFAIAISDDDAADWDCVGDIVASLEKRSVAS